MDKAKGESLSQSEWKDCLRMQLLINDGLMLTCKSHLMRIKRLEDIVEDLSVIVYEENNACEENNEPTENWLNNSGTAGKRW